MPRTMPRQTLSRGAAAAITAAEQVFVSPISFGEIARKVRIGKWPEMAPHGAQRPALLEEQGGASAGLGHEICPWPIR
ncbi:hypothetical protein [Methylobacterium platani]|uniref:hypothetical protein n=1 Tax=Methylobacterium platani TaxID=427683 RepID=UPI000AB91B6D|nr:hypothetical protein [Methylobacterium platani]